MDLILSTPIFLHRRRFAVVWFKESFDAVFNLDIELAKTLTIISVFYLTQNFNHARFV